MKLKVLGWIILAAIGIVMLEYFGLLGTKDIIEVRAHYMQYTCGKNNIDMRVNLVVNKPFSDLIGKVISPEVRDLTQDELDRFVLQKTSGFRAGDSTSMEDFILTGWVSNSDREHCTGAICFKVQQIKYAGDSTFVEF